MGNRITDEHMLRLRHELIEVCAARDWNMGDALNAMALVIGCQLGCRVVQDNSPEKLERENLELLIKTTRNCFEDHMDHHEKKTMISNG